MPCVGGQPPSPELPTPPGHGSYPCFRSPIQLSLAGGFVVAVLAWASRSRVTPGRVSICPQAIIANEVWLFRVSQVLSHGCVRITACSIGAYDMQAHSDLMDGVDYGVLMWHNLLG